MATERQQFLAGDGLPYLGGLIPTGGRNPPAVWRKDRTVHPFINRLHCHVGVAGERKGFPAISCLPYLGRTVPTAGEDPASVRRKCYRADPSLMPLERDHFATAGCFPQPRHVLGPAGAGEDP